MAEEAGRSRLGRGLAALMGEAGEESAAVDRARGPRRVPVEFVRANPRNPRRTFAEDDLENLAASIRERGVIQPIVVRAMRGASEAYELIAGERRWRAAQRAGLHDIPIVVIQATDGEALELAIIENVQRTDLNAIEEAKGYLSLQDEFRHSADAIAKIVGKSRSHVANTLRLLKLPETVQAHLMSGKLSAGQARVLIGAPNAEALAEAILSRGLNVRQVEAMARDSAAGEATAPRVRQRTGKDADTIAVEKRVSDALGLKVNIEHRGDGGSLQVHYTSLEQLEDVLRRLERGP